MIKKKLINIMLLFAVLSGNAVADDTSSKAIYDSKTKTLSLEGVLVPFIDEFTGKETDNKGIFDVQLEEKTKLVFELIPWSINFKNIFNGENTSGYILYDNKTRSVNIPCFEVTTIAKLGDGIEGKVIYYKDVSMRQRHIAYPIFHVEDMTETDNCESSVIPEPEEPPKKPTLTTTPTTTEDDTVEVEVNGEDGTTVFVNGVDTGKTIGSTGKVKITLDTSGETGDKNFSISLKDDKGNESDAITFVIEKKITHNNKLWDFSVEEDYISQYETKTAIRHDGIAILRGYDTLRNQSNGIYNGSCQGSIRYGISFEGLRFSYGSWYNKNHYHAHYRNGSNYNFTKITYKIESEDGYAIAYLADGTSLVWNKANNWQGYSVGDTIEYYPQKHLPTDKPYIELKNAKNFSSSVVSFNITYGANNEGSVKYQVSTDDGTTWKYWDGSAWTVTTQTDGTETSNDSDINANVRTLDTDGGNFKWRAYLESDGNQKVELDKIEVTFY